MQRVFSRPSYKLSLEDQRTTTATAMELTVSTWEKDSHGLFDYETTKLSNKKFRIKGASKIFRNWISADSAVVPLEEAKKGDIPNSSYSFLSSIGTHSNGSQEALVLYCPEKPSKPIYQRGESPGESEANEEPSLAINTNAYLVISNMKSKDGKIKGYSLSPGEVIKLGRMEYLVTEYQNHTTRQAIKSSAYTPLDHKHTVLQDYQGVCKICLQEQASESNFLLSPCHCKGSCEVIHLECLKNWINNKVKKESEGLAVTYNFVKFECELCKQPFPKLVYKNSVEYPMLVIEKPSKPYIIFQSLGEEKSLYVIIADEHVPIRLGRGHQCEIRMSDISVSRLHAEIKLTEDKFYISDNNSKFGTLVKLTKDVEIEDGLQVQCGRSLYRFGMPGSAPKSSAYL